MKKAASALSAAGSAGAVARTLVKQLFLQTQLLVDNAITKLNGYRGGNRFYQNQVESAVRNLMTQSTNVKVIESIIRDVDYAKRICKLQ